jgi:hypothetical protein
MASAVPAFAQSGGRVVIRAVSGDGQPVVDLKREEVTVRIDGKPREIKDLELVRPGAAAAPATPAAPAAVPASTLPAPFATNAGAAAVPKGAREILIAVDDEGIGSGREGPVREAITALIGKLAPGDRVGVIAMKQGGLNVTPTTQHASVTAALPKLISTGSMGETANDLACRTKVMLNSLAGFLQGAGPERTIVFFSSAITPPAQGTRTSSTAACEIRTDDFEGLGRVAQNSGAELFVVAYMDGLANSSNRQAGQTGLENVAGVTGGEFVMLSGAPDAVATRVIRTAGTYYVATLAEAGGGRRYDVRVSREGVRAAAHPLTGGGGSAAPGGKANLRDMVAEARMYRDLPLRAAAFVWRQRGSNDLSLIVLFEPHETSAKLNAATVRLFNDKGESKIGWNAQASDLQSLPVTAATLVPPGSYRVRVAAIDAEGRGGTTDIQMAAQLTDAGPVKLGALILGTDPKSFKLQFGPGDKAAIGFLPIYGVQKDMNVSVNYEIRESETAQPMGTFPGNLLGGTAGDERVYWAGVDPGQLAPGDYLMRAVVSIDGKEVGVATRTLRKVK